MRANPRHLVGVACLLLVSIGVASAQTLAVRQSISDGKGLDDFPRIAPLGGGRYAVTWVRPAGTNKWVVYGRVIDTDGNAATAVRKNLLGTTVFISAGGGHDSAAHGEGAFVIAGARSGDGNVFTRRFNAALKPLGALNLIQGGWAFPDLATGPSGTALAWKGANQTNVVKLDAAGRATGTPLVIQASATTREFTGRRILPAPTGFLVVGEEASEGYTQRRAAFSLIAADLTSATKVAAYEALYANSNNWFVDAGFDGQSGLVLFGNDASGGMSYYRQLKADGKPKGSAKRIPSESEWASWPRITPISGSGQFACSWSQYPWGYLQIRRQNGTAVAAAVTLSTGTSLRENTVEMAYDEDTQKLLVTWAETVDSKRNTIWVAIFDLQAD